MQVMTVLPQEDLRGIERSTQAAELAGYDQISSKENRYDPLLPLGIAAVASKTINIGTAVAIAFPRSPMVVANSCWGLQKASEGRFILGLGPQIKAHNQNRFSVQWSAPVTRMREYVAATRAIWRNWQPGEPLDFRGEHYKFTLVTPNCGHWCLGQASDSLGLFRFSRLGKCFCRESRPSEGAAKIEKSCNALDNR